MCETVFEVIRKIEIFLIVRGVLFWPRLAESVM